MQEHIICHCGKCNVKCNKHNKKAKCDKCKKVRMLGTAIIKGEMQHFCDKCCVELEKQLNQEEEKRVNEALKYMRIDEQENSQKSRSCERQIPQSDETAEAKARNLK